MHASTLWALLVICTVLGPQVFAADESAGERRQELSPEYLKEKLAELKAVIETEHQECPHALMRVAVDPLKEGETPGWVLVVFDVSPVGKIVDPEVADASLGEPYQVHAVEHLVHTLRFRPQAVKGNGVFFHNWVERVDYLPKDMKPPPTWPDPEAYMAKECPRWTE